MRILSRLKRWLTAMFVGIGDDEDWEKDCAIYWRNTLTGRHKHWCEEWDYLPLDDTCGEFHLNGISPDKCGSCGYFKPDDNK